MNRPWKTLRFFLLLAALLLALPVVSMRAALPVHDLLAQVPQGAFTSGYLSLTGVEALILARPGASGPFSGNRADARPFRLAMQGISGGFQDLVVLLPQAEDVVRATGSNPLAVRQSMAIGLPPFNQAWLAVEFEPNAPEETLKGKGYGPVSQAGSVMDLWAAESSLESATVIDLAKRDPGFLFGGMLGGRWPVAFKDGLIVSSRDAEALRQIASGEGPMLAERPAGKALLDAAVQTGGEKGGKIIQLYLLTPEHVWPDETGAAGISPPELVLLAQADGEDASQAVLAFYYAEEAGARSALSHLEARLPDAQIASTGRSLEDVIQNLDGQREEPRAVPAPDGAGVLLIPFRFPSQAAAAERNPDAASALSFRAFVTVLMKADLGWAKP